MKKKLFIALAVIAIAGAGYWYFFLNKITITPRYKLVKIERGSLEAIITSTGVVNPVNIVQVGSQVTGTLVRIFTDFNKHVQKGQLIALIDTTAFAAAVRDAEATLERAKAQLVYTENEFQRAKKMIQQDVNSHSEFDQAQFNFENAKASVKSAQANLERTRITLKFAFIRSPIDGTVVSRNVDVGQTVAASLSAPTLFNIADNLTKMQILANVDESDIGQIEEGQTVRFTVQAYPEKTFDGKVIQIRLQPTTIQNVVNYTVVISADNKGGYLLPGMTATTIFQIQHVDNVLKVPNAAIRFRATADMIAEAEKTILADPSIPDSVKAGRKKRLEQSGTRIPQSSGGTAGAKPRNTVAIWYVNDVGTLATVRVRLGISDGQMTEVRLPENQSAFPLKEGMEIIAGIVTQGQSQQSSGSPLRQTQPQTGQPRGF